MHTKLQHRGVWGRPQLYHLHHEAHPLQTPPSGRLDRLAGIRIHTIGLIQCPGHVLVTLSLLKKMRQYSTWYGHMSLKLWIVKRKLNVSVVGPSGWGLFKSLIRRMQTASIRPVHDYSMRSLQRKTSLFLVRTSLIRLPRRPHQNKVSLFVWTEPSTSGGSNI
jgi:hypothetical protein